MEIINKGYPGITKEDGRFSKPIISFAKQYISLSKGAVEEFGLIAGSKIDFVFDFDRLYFYVSDDHDGLDLTKDGNRSIGMRIKSKSFSNLIRKKMPVIKAGSRYPLRKSVTKLNGHELIEVLIHKKVK